MVWIRQMDKLTKQSIELFEPKFGSSRDTRSVDTLKERMPAAFAQVMAYQGIDEKEMNETLRIIKHKS